MPTIQIDGPTGAKKLPSHAKDGNIGGVVGCSILFHRAKFGWQDAALLERAELRSGSSWHAAGDTQTISSGGPAHHVSQSMAMGYVAAEFAKPGTTLQAEILGNVYNAQVLSGPIYDAGGANMRS